MATNFKEAYQELIKYFYNNVEDQDIYDNWMSFQLRELTELIEKRESEGFNSANLDDKRNILSLRSKHFKLIANS